MSDLTLVIGGVRSGKSRFAEQLAANQPPVTYLATALAGDDEEMAGRIARHQARRDGLGWRTIEESRAVPAVVAKHTTGTLLVECMTLWLTNLLVTPPALDDAAVAAEVGELLDAIGNAAGRVIVVSNETGCGIMPVNALARRFADVLGETNQQLAAQAVEVYWCVAGIPTRIKG